MSGSNDKYKYRIEIQQMMFVSGEITDHPVETTSLIEDIVRGQVIEILLQSTKTAHSRGNKNILPEDIIFLIRHDKAKVNRLRTYLSWKDLRKNAKDQDATASLNTAGTGGAGDDDGKEGKEGRDGKDKNGKENMMKVKKSAIKLPWELQFMFNEQPLDNDDANDLDEDEREANITTLKRLKIADDRTRNMTKEEYVHWSDCRQASFTFRKARRFKDWSGITHLIDGKPHDDIIDILGFLTFEIVCSITETALKIKTHEQFLKQQKVNKQFSSQSKASNSTSQSMDLKYETTSLSNTNGASMRKKRLFDGPDNVIEPLRPKHIEEAWRVLQAIDMKHRAVTNFKGGRLSSRTIIL